MRKIELLDCSLRDGGYLNDWNFGLNTITSIFERLVQANIDIIEVGFIDEERKFDINRTIFPNTKTIEMVFGELEKGHSKLVAMIDYGKCDITNIQPCKDSVLDGIRVIFKEHLMYEALNFCKQIKELGYIVFAQMVSITTYSDEKLKEIARYVNVIEPYAISMVDTYGLLHQENVMHIFSVLDEHISSNIAIGYHSHNNFQMAYANCIQLINTITKRNILVDGTLYGIGKSAGNAPIELLAMYMNTNLDKKYQIGQLLEAIDTSIEELKTKFQWGYNLFFYISASSKCHPSYVAYLLDKKTLSVETVMEILEKIQESEKLIYNKKLIETLYLTYQDTKCNDEKSKYNLKNELDNRNILLLGPGKSVKLETNAIHEYCKKKTPIVIAINFIPEDIDAGFIFLSNSKRYIGIATKISNPKYRTLKIIATSNLSRMQKSFDYVLNYSELIDTTAIFQDNSFIMMLKVIIELNIKNIAVAGFDGYSDMKENYFCQELEYDFVTDKAEYLNRYTYNFLKQHEENLNVEFITASKYTSYKENEI